MAVRFQPFTLLGSRTADSPRGAAEPEATRQVLVSLRVQEDPRNAGDFVVPFDLGLGFEVVAVELDLEATASVFTATAVAGVDRFVAVTPAGAHSSVAQTDPIATTTPVDASGLVVQVPAPCLQMSAATAAALSVALGTEFDAVVHMRDRFASSRGRAWVGRYIDDAVDPDPSTLATTTSMMQELAAYSARVPLGVVNTAQTYVNSAAMATVDPLNLVYIAATDIGVGTNKIPDSLTANTAQQFAFHPSVFVRRSNYIRGVAPAAPRNANGITTAAGATIIAIAQYAFTYSRWSVQIDGTEYEIIVDHNGGSYQRPIDIYQNVLAPRFTDGKITFYQRESNMLGSTFTPLGVLERFDFAQYLRFLDGYSENEVDPPFAIYAQTGNPAAAGGGA